MIAQNTANGLANVIYCIVSKCSKYSSDRGVPSQLRKDDKINHCRDQGMNCVTIPGHGSITKHRTMVTTYRTSRHTCLKTIESMFAMHFISHTKIVYPTLQSQSSASMMLVVCVCVCVFRRQNI
jgi:hypothetical protein